ncbi:tRNA (5-methylaminomethyl-2-thiouridylate)-methyltransferase [Halorhodospira abdelmalekii]|uniref:tRNA (5-methylaminomethyl-2-thiouridylate)-methyltransferase n=1 Tax=Halorhodospira abdelmalekii TaxID=421629 RepID=UPI001906C04D|nr:tRNA (5-methylaminomethyl-2-thiouridylate)-methyltransferase [Halorhodospira abdelmalekii]MBK1733708.1 tRNA (5-methylaminomethyl-2-thiouridylate)-methyltransferase [Halorhodospira abdelmalekii]
MSEQPKALALISGGLDSMLAARIVQTQGVHVEGVNFFTGFCVEGHTHAIRAKDRQRPKRNNALWVAEQLGIKLHIEDVVAEYQTVLTDPRYGYGANLNPCLDCKIFMVRKAREWIEANGFDFIVTGEVVGQRPKSQKRRLLPIVERESGAEERLLRPLSAKRLPPTLPERAGWVDREQLFDFQGRSRKPQMALAQRLGIAEWAQPAGGCCFLTDAHYSAKLVDLWQARGAKNYDMDDIMLLKVGRHLRPRPHFKLIIAREEGENHFLEGYRYRFPHLRTVSCTGPLALVDGTPETEEEWQLAASLVARFSSGRTADSVEIAASLPEEEEIRHIDVAPLCADEIPASWYVGVN